MRSFLLGLMEMGEIKVLCILGLHLTLPYTLKPRLCHRTMIMSNKTDSYREISLKMVNDHAMHAIGLQSLEEPGARAGKQKTQPCCNFVGGKKNETSAMYMYSCYNVFYYFKNELLKENRCGSGSQMISCLKMMSYNIGY